MTLLAILEFFVYRDTWMKYEYEVDKDFSRLDHLNVHMILHIIFSADTQSETQLFFLSITVN